MLTRVCVSKGIDRFRQMSVAAPEYTVNMVQGYMSPKKKMGIVTYAFGVRSQSNRWVQWLCLSTYGYMDMIWYGMMWYDMIWYDMIWYDMIWVGVFTRNDKTWTCIWIWYDMHLTWTCIICFMNYVISIYAIWSVYDMFYMKIYDTWNAYYPIR